MVVLSVVTKIITKTTEIVTETATIQKFMENYIFTTKKGKNRILLNKLHFVK